MIRRLTVRYGMASLVLIGNVDDRLPAGRHALKWYGQGRGYASQVMEGGGVVASYGADGAMFGEIGEGYFFPMSVLAAIYFFLQENTTNFDEAGCCKTHRFEVEVA